MLRILLAVTAFVLFLPSPARATINCNDRGCYDDYSKSARFKTPRPTRTAAHVRVKIARTAIAGARAGGQASVASGGLVTVTTAAELNVGPTVRPRECYGIQWCGCWLRHIFGIADSSLNLAINWASRGTPATPETANVVVWHHHVAKLLGHDGRRILIQSGNDRGAVRTRWVSTGILGGVVAYRRI